MAANIRHSCLAITEKALGDTERKLGISLPDEYRRFLRRHNGGVPRPEWFPISENGEVSGKPKWFPIPKKGQVIWFLSVGRTGILDPRWLDFERAFAKLKRPGSTLPARLVPVAEVWTFSNPGVCSDFLCISVEGTDLGKIYFWRDIEGYRSGVPVFVAESFEAFLSDLYHGDGEPLPWVVLIQDGDIARLGQWLRAEGKRALEACDRYNLSPLDHAVMEGRWEVLQLLLEHGASVTQAFKVGLDRKRFALVRNLLPLGVKSLEIKESLPTYFVAGLTEYFWQDLDLLRSLLDAGADPKRQEEDGSTPLHIAAASGEPSAVRMLLDHGAKAGIWNDKGETAMHGAARATSLETMKLLIDAGEDLHAKHPPKASPPFQVNVPPEMQPLAEQLRPVAEQLLAFFLGRKREEVSKTIEKGRRAQSAVSAADILDQLGRHDLKQEIEAYQAHQRH
jgi:ankyrin repeat protein